MSHEKIMVLGAGFQGICAALSLCRKGYSVVLVDKARDCMLRASLRNEGKIHLGFVYANDETFKTSTLMLQSSLAFAGLIDNWLGAPADWAGLKSRPFTYVVAKDSMLPPSRILASYERLQNLYQASLNGPSTSYLGERPKELWREVSSASIDSGVNRSFAAKFVETVEVALNLDKFRELLRTVVNELDEIERLYSHSVASVERTSAGFRVEGIDPDGRRWRREAGAVVNCLWDGRLKLDEQLGLAPTRKWVYRLKYRLLGELPSALSGLPSMTIVLGPYGDVVINPPAKTYFSWYPACMKGWSSDRDAPSAWEAACDGREDKELTKHIIREALHKLDEIIPGVRHARIEEVDAGIIFSWGRSDISDPQSELHERFDIGVQSHDGYFSINTGKFTCAPLFAGQLLKQVD